MVVEIDVDKLKAKRAELTAELTRLGQLIELAESFSRPVQEPTPVQDPAPQSHVSNGHEPARGFTPGLRRAVIMALHTGPCTESELSKALVWPHKRTRIVVQSMLKFKIAFLSEFGKLNLSEEGKKQALWYLENPDYLTYRPNGYNTHAKIKPRS